jgi:uncharacterized repeat protein (TIGR01451 family)
MKNCPKKLIAVLIFLFGILNTSHAQDLSIVNCLPNMDKVLQYKELEDTSILILGEEIFYKTHTWDYFIETIGDSIFIDSIYVDISNRYLMDYKVYTLARYDKNNNLMWANPIDTQYSYQLTCLNCCEGDQNDDCSALNMYKPIEFKLYNNNIYIAYLLETATRKGVITTPGWRYGDIEFFPIEDSKSGFYYTIMNLNGNLLKSNGDKKVFSGIDNIDDGTGNIDTYINFCPHSSEPNFYVYSYYNDGYSYTLNGNAIYSFDIPMDTVKILANGTRTSVDIRNNSTFKLVYNYNNNKNALLYIDNFQDTVIVLKDMYTSYYYGVDAIYITFLDSSNVLLSVYKGGYFIFNTKDYSINKLNYSKILYNTDNSIDYDVDSGVHFQQLFYNYYRPYTDYQKYILNNLGTNMWELLKFEDGQFLPIDTIEDNINGIKLINNILIIEKKYEYHLFYYQDKLIVKTNGVYSFNDIHLYEGNLFLNYNGFYEYNKLIFLNIENNAVINLDINGEFRYFYSYYLPLRNQILFSLPNLPKVNALYTHMSGCNVAFYTLHPKANLYVKAMYDENANGIIDNGEGAYSGYNIKYTTPEGAKVARYFQDTVGYNIIGLDTGYYQFQFSANNAIYTVFNPIHNVHYANVNQSDTIVILVQPISPVGDISVRIDNIGASRPGFDNRYVITVKNNGTKTMKNTVFKILYDQNKMDFKKLSYNYYSRNDTLISYSMNLPVSSEVKFYFDFIVKTPPTVNNGDTLKTQVWVNSSVHDDIPYNNYHRLQDIVVGSYDPNDKSVDDTLIYTDNPIAHLLTYTIRFENTGNYYAQNVILRDTLPQGLDGSTLKVIAASHNYDLSIVNDSILEFRFLNINLDYSDLMNDGFIKYSVYTKPEYSGAIDPIKNKAEIFFDFNLPIVTNFASTVIQLTSTGIKDNTTNSSLLLYPNPTAHELHIDDKWEGNIENVYMIDLQGRIITVNWTGKTIHCNNLESGLYQVVIVSEGKIFTSKMVKM